MEENFPRPRWVPPFDVWYVFALITTSCNSTLKSRYRCVQFYSLVKKEPTICHFWLICMYVNDVYILNLRKYGWTLQTRTDFKRTDRTANSPFLGSILIVDKDSDPFPGSTQVSPSSSEEVIQQGKSGQDWAMSLSLPSQHSAVESLVAKSKWWARPNSRGQCCSSLLIKNRLPTRVGEMSNTTLKLRSLLACVCLFVSVCVSVRIWIMLGFWK